MQKFNVPCFDPPNGGSVVINTGHSIPIGLSTNIIAEALKLQSQTADTEQVAKRMRLSVGSNLILANDKRTPVYGVILVDANLNQHTHPVKHLRVSLHIQRVQFVTPAEAVASVQRPSHVESIQSHSNQGHQLRFKCEVDLPLDVTHYQNNHSQSLVSELLNKLYQSLNLYVRYQ